MLNKVWANKFTLTFIRNPNCLFLCALRSPISVFYCTNYLSCSYCLKMMYELPRHSWKLVKILSYVTLPKKQLFICFFLNFTDNLNCFHLRKHVSQIKLTSNQFKSSHRKALKNAYKIHCHDKPIRLGKQLRIFPSDSSQKPTINLTFYPIRAAELIYQKVRRFLNSILN